MSKKQFENDNFVLYATDSLNYVTYDIIRSDEFKHIIERR